MPEKTTNLNLPIPLGNENVNRQYFVDLIQAIDSGAVSEEQLAEQVKRLTEGKQDVVRLADNFKAPTAAITEYPQGFSVFYVGGGTGGQGAAWATAAGATETFGWVETVRTGSAGHQTFTEMYSGTDTTATSGNRQFKRNKRDSNSFWQPFERVLDQDDLVAHNADYVRQPGYAATAGTGAAYTVTLSPAPAALVDGLAITIVPHVANTVADPTLKIGALAAMPIRRQSGGQFAAGSIKAGQPLSLIKVGSYFLARSVGATGDATPAQVRAGAKFSNESNVDLVGTLPIRATTAQTIIPNTTDQVLNAGIYDGAITVKGDANLVPENILYGKSVYGIAGTLQIPDVQTRISYPYDELEDIRVLEDSTERSVRTNPYQAYDSFMTGFQVNFGGSIVIYVYSFGSGWGREAINYAYVPLLRVFKNGTLILQGSICSTDAYTSTLFNVNNLNAGDKLMFYFQTRQGSPYTGIIKRFSLHLKAPILTYGKLLTS